jgi:hypothetical protein
MMNALVPMVTASGTRYGWFGLGCCLLVSSWAGSAQAACAPPDPLLAWSYPDATTEVVPLDAHFWALVPRYLEPYLSVELDGETIARALSAGTEGDDAVRRAEYAPGAPLEPGEHELAVTVGENPFGAPGAVEVHRFSFRAEALPPVTFQAELVSVTQFRAPSEAYEPRPGDGLLPEDFQDPGCSGRIIDTTQTCYDGGPPSEWTRVELDASGDALAYVVANMLVPTDCRVFYPFGPVRGEPYEVTPLLPTGSAPVLPFAGEVEVLGGDPAARGGDAASGGCSMARPEGAPSSNAAACLGALSLGAVWLARRRRRPNEAAASCGTGNGSDNRSR